MAYWGARLFVVTNIIWAIKSRTGHVALIREEINSHGILMGKPERKRPVGSRRRGWNNIILT